MTLSKQTLLIIGVTFFGLVAIQYMLSQLFLLESYARLEKQEIFEDTERVLSILKNELSNLDVTTADWASWDETYTFIVDQNEDYVETNLVDETFTALRVDFMVFTNASGQIVFSRSHDPHNKEQIAIPQSLQKHFSGNSVLVRHADPESNVTGIILLPEGPLLVASHPILTSRDQGPIRGTLVFGRYFDSLEIERLTKMTQLSFTVCRFNDSQLPLDFQAVRSFFSEETSIIVRPLDARLIAGYALIKDIYGKPALIIRVDEVRHIYHQGRTSVFYFVLWLMIIGIVSGTLIIFILRKLVLSRMSDLSEDVSRISATSQFSRRVSIRGKDEISNLADEINRLLKVLEKSLNEREEVAKKLEKAYHELEETQDQLIKSSKMASIGTLAAGVSHEINNPLNIILGFCQLLLDEVDPHSEMFKDLKKIEKHTRNCKRIVENLLQFARKSEIAIGEVDINRGLREALDLVRNQFALQNIEIDEELSPALPTLEGDHHQLQQVFVNLFNNAGQAMPRGGVLTVETNYLHDENKVSIQISDTGEGIRRDDLPYIFDPFFTTRDHSGGAGLGLSVSHGIIESHQGEILCKSQSAEEKPSASSGTTFTIILPIKIPDQSSRLKGESA